MYKRAKKYLAQDSGSSSDDESSASNSSHNTHLVKNNQIEANKVGEDGEEEASSSSSSEIPLELYNELKSAKLSLGPCPNLNTFNHSSPLNLRIFFVFPMCSMLFLSFTPLPLFVSIPSHLISIILSLKGD